MKQIIYHSQPFGFDQAMLSGILLQARRNNQRDDITGALICRRDMYLQMVEGPDEAIDALYAKITEDARHSGVTLAFTGTAESRLFPDWNMLDDSMPGVTFSCEGIADGGVDEATPEALLTVFTTLSAKVAS